MATPARNVRVDDELWEAAKAAVERRGATVSGYLVGKLRELVEADQAEQAWRRGLELEEAGR